MRAIRKKRITLFASPINLCLITNLCVFLQRAHNDDRSHVTWAVLPPIDHHRLTLHHFTLRKHFIQNLAFAFTRATIWNSISFMTFSTDARTSIITLNSAENRQMIKTNNSWTSHTMTPIPIWKILVGLVPIDAYMWMCVCNVHFAARESGQGKFANVTHNKQKSNLLPNAR